MNDTFGPHQHSMLEAAALLVAQLLLVVVVRRHGHLPAEEA